jgi:SAM-dependent methyltransferase
MPETMSCMYEGWVDAVNPDEISGWAADPERPEEPLFIDIAVNGDKVASVKACLFRVDLKQQGFGDGRKVFTFNPSAYLQAGENHVRISYADTGETLPNGDQSLVQFHVGGLEILRGKSAAELLEVSQLRWRGDEEDPWLTWRSIMTGDSFIDVVQQYHGFSGQETILEVGPGYGRLLKTLLGRRVPFARYVGLEISRDRVERLARQFRPSAIGRVGARGLAEKNGTGTWGFGPFFSRVGQKLRAALGGQLAPKFQFVAADILRDTVDCQADVVLCSSTFEHLFPSMLTALWNLRKMAHPGTRLFIDFIRCDDELATSAASFEETTAYIRIYSRQELERLFTEAGFRVLGIEPIVLGKASTGQDVRRALVIAEWGD